MKKSILLLCCVCCLTACTKYAVRGEQAAKFFQKDRVVYVVNNDATRDGFLNVMKDWLSKNQYRVKVINESTDISAPYLTYVGKWSWDLGIFLADSTIKIFSDGYERGASSIKVSNGFNLNKYGGTELKINNLMSLLFFHQMENGEKVKANP
ncbi:MAG: Sbal_3080 family lipoprotein [Elusimicrobiota bacterium]|jgi:hypothetical protein|nr:Sbal_3080 family lipoprotein [Elusimicrobiota bacterium]